MKLDQRQTEIKSCKRSNISSKRTTCSATANSSTAVLSTRPFAVAATRFHPLSEPRPATKTSYERMTATVFPTPPSAERPQSNRNRKNQVWFQNTTTMIITITLSICHPLAQLFCTSNQSMEGSCGQLRVSCGKVHISCTISCGEIHSVVGFLVRQEESAGA